MLASGGARGNPAGDELTLRLNERFVAGHPYVDGWGLFLLERIADRFGVARERANAVWFELERRQAAARRRTG